MKVTIVGSGYVGTTLAACLAEIGHEVVAIDIDEEPVAAINAGESPIHEPGLDELVAEHAGGNLTATTDYAAVADSEVTFLALPTPSRDDGSVDVSAIESGAESVGSALARAEQAGAVPPGEIARHLVVIKSTVTPAVPAEVVVPAIERGLGRELVPQRSADDADAPGRFEVGVATNPEFLREGSAVSDLRNPDKMVFGYHAEWAGNRLEAVFEPLLTDAVPVVRTDPATAMMIKYANNAFLAAKISLINELGNVCKEYGIDAYEVADAIGLDDRIGERFLRSGVGFGGSCLTGDQYVLAKDETGTKHLTLAEFFERYVSEGTVEDITVLSRSADGQFEFKPVDAATRRQYEGPLHTIRTKMNKRVTITHDHPMVTLDGEDTAVKPAAALKPSDSLPVVADLPSDPVSAFDLIEIVDGSPSFENNRVYLKPSTSFGTIKEELYEVLREYNRQFDYHKVSDLVRNNYLPLDVFLTYEEELPVDREELSLYTTKGGGQTYVPAIVPADEQFWRFIGYYLSEGHINDDTSGHGSTTRRRVQLSFHPTDEMEYVRDVESYYETLGIRYRTAQQATTTDVCVSSRVFAEFLEWLGCGTGSYSASIPDPAFQATADERVALLSGLFRGDGHVEYTSHSNAVVYDYGSVSEELIDGMTLLLHSLGIVPSYKTSQSAKSTRPAHFLRVSSKRQISALKELFLPEERDRIDKRLAEYERDIVPTGHTADGGFTSVPVRDVTVEETTAEVYSLEVADNHTFVTTDGLVVHNCFPKDVDALRAAARDRGYQPDLLDAAVAVNEKQPERLLELLDRHVDVDGRRVAVLGLAFKPGTDDTRNSRAVPVIEGVTERGGAVVAYDPVAVGDIRERYPHLEFEAADSAEAALSGAHAAVVVTDWDEFAALDSEFDGMAEPVVIDGRRIIERRDGITYEGLTW